MPLRRTAAAVGLVLVLAAGCGEQRETKVVVAGSVPAAEVERYAPGTPTRSLLELIQGAQHNDPTAITERLAPQWGATPERLVGAMPTISRVTQGFGIPRVLAVRRGAHRAAVDLRWGGQRGTFILVPNKHGWWLARILVNGRRLKIAGLTSP